MPASTPFQFACATDHQAMSQLAVAQIVAQLRTKPDSLLVLATGSTPHRAYQFLADQGRAEQGLFDQMRILKLDEWGGLAMDDPATCPLLARLGVVAIVCRASILSPSVKHDLASSR